MTDETFSIKDMDPEERQRLGLPVSRTDKYDLRDLAKTMGIPPDELALWSNARNATEAEEAQRQVDALREAKDEQRRQQARRAALDTSIRIEDEIDAA